MPRSDPESLRGLVWRAVASVPWTLWRPIVGLGTAVLATWPTEPVRRWNGHFAMMAGRPARWRDTRRGLTSWARNVVQSLRLARWDAQTINAAVVISDEDRARLTSLAAEPGAVVGLPHAGSWDLCGAWACLHGMPVSSVAEELAPAEFAVFVGVRERLGFRIYSHRDPRVWPKLVADARERRLVCLMADRNFSRRGVAVQWRTATGPQPISMPPGPARLALRSGAALLGISSHYHGERLHIVVSPALEPSDPGASELDRVADLTQQLCDFFAEQVRAHPHDWHMLQPFFAPGAPLAATRGAHR